MSLLDSEHTVQVSPSMLAAVNSVRAWLGGPSGTCVVVASVGSGKSHLLTAARHYLDDPVVMPATDGEDCTEFIGLLQSSIQRTVIADDLDKFSKKLREDVVKHVASCDHSLLASMTELSERMRSLLFSKRSATAVVSLDDPTSRPEDIEAFVERWLMLNDLAGDGRAAQECARYCCASALPQGLRTVERFLDMLAEDGCWNFSGPLPSADAASAYRQATAPPPTRPTILVEGYTDRIYLEWLLEGLRPSQPVAVQDCDGARRVAEQAIAIRNQGRPCVAVLDADDIGGSLRKQLREYGHPVVSVPTEAVDLPKSAYEHVKEIAEIEDLLPVSLIEDFLSSRDRKAELEIRASTGVRYVIRERDKRDLARWVVEDKDWRAAPKLANLLKEALKLLEVSA